MSTETQALAKGTRVEIKLLCPDCFGEVQDRDVDVKCLDCGSVVGTEQANAAWHVRELARTKTELLLAEKRIEAIENPPEPTVGQLVDAMHQEIERVCEKEKKKLSCLEFTCRPMHDDCLVIVEFWPYGMQRTEGKTWQAALRAMIERLREVKA